MAFPEEAQIGAALWARVHSELRPPSRAMSVRCDGRGGCASRRAGVSESSFGTTMPRRRNSEAWSRRSPAPDRHHPVVDDVCSRRSRASAERGAVSRNLSSLTCLSERRVRRRADDKRSRVAAGSRADFRRKSRAAPVPPALTIGRLHRSLAGQSSSAPLTGEAREMRDPAPGRRHPGRAQFLIRIRSFPLRSSAGDSKLRANMPNEPLIAAKSLRRHASTPAIPPRLETALTAGADRAMIVIAAQ